MNEQQISIIVDDKMSDIFVRANTALVKSSHVNLQNFNQLQTLWMQHYKAKINLSTNMIEFQTEQDKTMFLLKWS